jgi:hypothetical protein
VSIPRLRWGRLRTRMPVYYRIDFAAERIDTACVGEVSLDEVLGHFRELAAAALPRRLDVLLDLTQMTSLPETGEIRQAADALVGTTMPTRFRACAVVAKENVLFGMSRMWVVYAESAFERVHVFRDRGEAERWLADGD